MATGLVDERAGAQPRDPRQLQRSRPGQSRRARTAQPRPGQPRPAQPRPDQPRPAQPRPDQTRPAQAPSSSRPRTPFILLLLALLGGGLVCLLLINTTLAEGSFRITDMQQKNAALAQQVQAAQQQTGALDSPASIAARAQQLGMRPVGRLRFLDLKTGRVYSESANEPGVATVPGYTP